MSGVIDVGVRDTRKLTLAERLYLPAIFKGMVVTMRHLVRNLTHLRRLPTILYPEHKRDYSDRFRGKHILTTRDDGTLKCVACYMCAEACPAECITIVAGDHPKLSYEKYPVVFDIDMLRCVFCGFCVDACPEEAIIMSRELEICAYTREETMWDIKRLMNRPELPEFGLGYRPNDKLVDSTIKFVPLKKKKTKLAGRVTLKEDVEMIPHVTFDPTKD